jgi:hypothetical protein
MDPRYSAQDILLCASCDAAPVKNHCEVCNIDLCNSCVGEHFSDSSRIHRILPFNEKSSRPNFPKCPDHPQRSCELYCDTCDDPVCPVCISSGTHKRHNLFDILEKHSRETEKLAKDLRELEKNIHPKYETITTDINSEKDKLETHYGELLAAVTKHGEKWHQEIDNQVSRRKSDIEDMKMKHMAILTEQGDEIKQNISELNQLILDIKKILDSNDISSALVYKSMNDRFRSIPKIVKVSLPTFTSGMVDAGHISEKFGCLSELSIKTEEDANILPVKRLLDKPQIIATIYTSYGALGSIACLNDEEVWACTTYDEDTFVRLFNLQGKIVKSIQTTSRNKPYCIALANNGDMIYSEYERGALTIIKNEQLRIEITLQDWKPRNVCSTSNGDFLVTMKNSSLKQCKVVRYSENTEIQAIQFDGRGKALYSPHGLKDISENRNSDICVADSRGKTVVVVNQSGKLRFRYTGHSRQSFSPSYIATDSQSRILTSDLDNHRIHIIDRNGMFLRYIGNNNCDLYHPFGLSVDNNDNLFVAESRLFTGKLKKIRYLC